ncbi:MAG: flagellar export protein FliJ [Candidatus Goldiibacteriota bacterium]
MKKFVFRFDTVLRVKEKKEEALKRELMHLTALRLEQEKIRKAVSRSSAENLRMKNEEKQKGTDIGRLIYYEQHLSVLRYRIVEAEKKIQELHKMADRKREEVVEASKEKKIFEKLRDRDYKIFNKNILAAEQKQLDETSISKYNRKEQHNF